MPCRDRSALIAAFFRKPLSRFLIIGAVTIGALVVGTQMLATDAANREALAELSSVNEVLAYSVGAEEVKANLFIGKKVALDRFTRVADRQVQAPFLQRLNVWSKDGLIVYSTDILAAGDDVQGVEIPDELNVTARYPVAALDGGAGVDERADIEIADEFVAFVVGEEGQAVLARFGFGPP